MQDKTEIQATPKVDDFSTRLDILEQICIPGTRVFFFGRHDEKRIMLSAEIIKLDIYEGKLYTHPTMSGKQPMVIEPGNMLVAQVIGANGLLRFPVDLQYTHRDHGYVFNVHKRLARIEQRRHKRINIYATGAILEITGERRMLIDNPVPSNLSRSGMRIWVDIGNIHSMHEYKLDLEFSMHKNDPFAPKMRLITPFYIMLIFLSGDGVEVPYHYEAAGYFYEDKLLTERLEKYIDKFEGFIPNLESQKLQLDANLGKITAPKFKNKRK